MPSRADDGPQPACVEDYDDDRGTVFSDTRVHARTGKDGSDSGYSSRTGTVDGDQYDSKAHAVQIERQRAPYVGVIPIRRRESMNQQKQTRPVAPEPVRPPKEEKKKFCHAPGICWTCDKVGYHMTQEELDELKNRLTREKSSTKETPKPAREVLPAEVKERPTDAKLRRMSSHRESRPPVPQYPPTSMPQMQPPPSVPAGYYGYGTPLTPSGYPPQPVYPSYSYPQTPSTSMAPPYVVQPPQADYFPSNVPEIRPPRPRRASTYGNQAPERLSRQYEEPVYVRREPPPPVDASHPKKEMRPAAVKHVSSMSIDRDRYEQDRRQMPPPELPSKRAETVHRPIPKKSNTYTEVGPRRSSIEESRQAALDSLERRKSKLPDEYDQDTTRALRPVRAREDLPSPAPSSYKNDSRDLPSRPAARQSASYSGPHYTQSVAKSSAPIESTRRRVTEPVTPMDAKVAEAEAYQQKRTSMVSDSLPTEQLRSSRTSRGRSETGSNYSHRESHYSTSKDTTATKNSRRNSIVIETGGKSRPLSIQMPNGLTVQIGGDQEKEKEEKRKQKLLEHAPQSTSGTSHSTTSRSRAATSSHPSSDRGKDRDYQEKSSKRSSHVVESRPPASPVKTTKSSRAPSRSRAPSDTSGSRNRRASVVSERVILRH
jgi:hypothetical protein